MVAVNVESKILQPQQQAVSLKQAEGNWLLDLLSFHHPTKAMNRWVCLTHMDKARGWSQEWVRPTELHQKLKKIDRSQDWWVSQAQFSERVRDATHIAYMSSNFLDLDWKLSDLGLVPTKERGVELVLNRCAKLRIPLPNIIVFTGNGLHVKWRYRYLLHHEALPRWNAVQSDLYHHFKDLGADPKSLDAARVLRLPGTINTKPGTFDRDVCVIYSSKDTYTFDEFATAVLHWTQDECFLYQEKKKSAKAERTIIKSSKTPRAGKGFIFKRNACDFTAMAKARMEDIIHLLELRRDSSGNVPQSHREECLFWGMNFGIQAKVITPENFDTYAWKFIHLCGKRFTDTPEKLTTLRNRLNQGQETYRARTSILIQKMSITEEEQAQLTVLTNHRRKKIIQGKQPQRVGKRTSRSTRKGWSVHRRRSKTTPKVWKKMGISRSTFYSRKSQIKKMVAHIRQSLRGYSKYYALELAKALQILIKNKKRTWNQVVERIWTTLTLRTYIMKKVLDSSFSVSFLRVRVFFSLVLLKGGRVVLCLLFRLLI